MKIRPFPVLSMTAVSLSLLAASTQAFLIPGSYAPLFEAPAVVPQIGNRAGKMVDNFNLSSFIGKSRIMLLSTDEASMQKDKEDSRRA